MINWTINSFIARFIVTLGLFSPLSGETVTDTVYTYAPDDLLDQPIIVIDWVQDLYTYFVLDMDTPYDVLAVEFQLLSTLDAYYPGDTFGDQFPIVIRAGTLEGDLTLGRELYPIEDTGNPQEDVYSALPGEELISTYFVIPDSTHLYPNWYHFPLDEYDNLHGLTENLLVGGWPFVWYMVCDSENSHHQYTFENWDWSFWRIGSFARAIRLIIQYDDETSIEPGNTNPIDYALYTPHPNPFNPATTIQFELPSNADVELNIFNAIGTNIYSQKSASLPAGRHSFLWNGLNHEGLQVASGIYLFNIETREYMATKKGLLIR